MATLTIRNLPETVRDRIRVRAAKRGVSMEAEVRDILAEAVAPVSRRDRGASVADVQRWIAKSRKKLRSEKNDVATLIRDRRREAILEVIRAGDVPAEVFGDNYARVLSEAGWTASDVKSFVR